MKEFDFGRLMIPVMGIALIGAVMLTDRADSQDVSRAKLREDIETSLQIERESELAQKDWDKCNFARTSVTDANGTSYYARISEGDVITDTVTGRVLPNNTVVCSKYGDIGVMRDGRAKNVRVNQEVVRINQKYQDTTQEVR